MGDSPITTPQTPNSEPPTPTTNHTSSKLLNQALDSSNDEKDVTTYLQKENDEEGEDESNHNDSIYAPIFHKSHLSVTSSCLSVKSMGSSIVDTDMESIFGKPQIPTSIESKPKVPSSKIGQTAGIFRVSSSCMSVKSMGSSIVDTDMESIVSKPQIPSSIEGKLVSPPMKNNSHINLEEEEEENIPSFLTGMDYNRHIRNHPDNDNSEDDINDDNLSTNSSGRRGNDVNGDVLSFLTEFKSQMMSQMEEIRSSHHRDTENLIHLLKNESNRRSVIEGRLHAQMLLQAETIVAMEIKLLRLESKLEEKENEKRRRMATEITHRRGDEVDGTPRRNDLDFRGLSNETIDEEDTDVDSAAFHVPGEGTMREIQVTTRTHESAENERQHRSLQTSRGENHQNMATHGSNPTNIAVISSGVSLASGVTATSFLEETQGAEDQVGRLTGVKVVTRDDRSARSDDGDVEDNETADNEEEDDDDDVAESFNDDGSASSKF
jgi:hypothetical protein